MHHRCAVNAFPSASVGSVISGRGASLVSDGDQSMISLLTRASTMRQMIAVLDVMPMTQVNSFPVGPVRRTHVFSRAEYVSKVYMVV